MRDLLFRIRSSQYLSNNEVLAIKVIFVILLLFIVGSITVPVNILFSSETITQIVFPLSFVVTFLATIILNFSGKPRLAMNASIYSFGIIAASYFSTASPLYIYLMFFALLGILIFYQDFYSFAVYGTVITTFGVIYMFLNLDSFSSEIFALGGTLQVVIYQGTLGTFYIFFLLNFINSEIANDRYIKEFLETKSYTKNYIELIVRLKDAMNDRDRLKAIYDRNSFQQALLELSTFLGEIAGFRAKEIQELVEFYLYLHEIDPDVIINRKDINPKTRSYAKQFKRYLINKNNEFMGLAYELVSETKEGLGSQVKSLETQIQKSYFNSTDRFIATSILYRYLKTEVTQLDKWGRTDETLTHQDIREVLQKSQILNYLNPSEINLFLDNEDLFKRFL
jgi:hypothetical protein